jgi:hypothetical protein
MKTHSRVLEKYRDGRLTTTGLILETLDLPEEEMIDEVLEAVPEEVRDSFSLFVDDYTPGMVIINGPRPREDAIQHARDWLARRRGADKRYRDLLTCEPPYLTLALCDRFVAWLGEHEKLPGAETLLTQATDTVEQRRQGHVRKCFGAVYLFLHEHPRWVAPLVDFARAGSPQEYFQPSPELLADWIAHVEVHASLARNDVINYPTLRGFLPVAYGGTVTGGGGGVSTLRRTLPLVACFLADFPRSGS